MNGPKYDTNSWALLLATISLGVTLMGLLAVLAFGLSVRETGEDNRIMVCSITRLVAHVPAIQFEGEPLDNFVGWIEARRDMLDAIHQRNICTKDEQLLEERVKLDRQLLEEIRKGR